MTKYAVEYTQVVHKTWFSTYEASSQEEAEQMMIKEIDDSGWDCEEDIVNGLFNVREITE